MLLKVPKHGVLQTLGSRADPETSIPSSPRNSLFEARKEKVWAISGSILDVFLPSSGTKGLQQSQVYFFKCVCLENQMPMHHATAKQSLYDYYVTSA